MKIKKPYLQEKNLLPRVIEYMKECENADKLEVTDYLIETYRDFNTKSRIAFMRSVEKAMQYYKACQEKQQESKSEMSDEDIMDHDGGGPDIIEVQTPKGGKTPKNKKTPKTPKMKNNMNDFIVIDTEGEKVVNGTSTPENATPKRPSLKTPKSAQKRKDTISDFFLMDTDDIKIDESRILNRVNQTPEGGLPKKKRKEGGLEIESMLKKKKKKLLVERPEVTFAQMAGLELLKDKICDFLANLQWPGVLQPLQKSALITGPTGSGKTNFVQALAGTAAAALLRITATELVGGVSGESEEKISEIFEEAAANQPCILLIEKIDVVAPKQGSAKSLEKRIGAQLSACLGSLKTKHKDSKILVLAETGHPENLDLDLRSSFDTEIFMSIPTEAARAKILQLMCQNVSFNGSFDEIALRTPGYVAGDLRKLVEKAQGLAWKRKKNFLFGKTGASLMEEIQNFLVNFEKMCESEARDAMVTINMEDFLESLLHITPVLKREGFPTVPDVTWQDIGGLEDIKKELREKILEPIKFAKLHEEFGASRPNGILMWGPPGCGKTLLAKAVANEAGINLLPVMGPELLNMYQGESERAVREVFTRARNVAPCVIFFDEFDSLCPVRIRGAESGSKTTIVNTLLTEMNGFAKREDVYVIAATNRPDILDPAVTRPGRFDTLLYVDVPDHIGRVSIFQARTKNGTCPQIAADVDFFEVSKLCSNFSGADCDQLVYLASKEAIREVIHGSQDAAVQATGEETTKIRVVANRHFSAALKKMKPSITPDEHKRYKKLHIKMGAVPQQEDSVGETIPNNSVDKEPPPVNGTDTE